MTFDTSDVLAGLAEASAEGFATAKQVASIMGIKGSSPLIKSVRTELDRLARQGRIETELDPSVGRRYRTVEEASGPAGIMARMERRAKAEEDGRLPEEEPGEESEEESEDEPAQEPDDDEEEEHQRLRRRTLPTATHRVLKVLSDGQRRRMMDLKGYGISSTTLKPMREAKLVSADSEGYVITEEGLRGLAELEEDWPELRGRTYTGEPYTEARSDRPKGRMPSTAHAMLCALLGGNPVRAKDLDARGIGCKTHTRVYQEGWCDRTPKGYVITEAGRRMVEEIERDWPELAASRPDPIPAEEPAEAPKPKPEPVQKTEKLPGPEPEEDEEEAPGYDGPDPVPEPAPMSEPENAVVLDVRTIYRLTVRTAHGNRAIDLPAEREDISAVLGRMTTMLDAVGRTVRLRTVYGEFEQIGHSVDDEWRHLA